MVGVPWTPVYDYGCGHRDCPECGPMIELEIECKHRTVRDKTFATDALFLGGEVVVSLAERAKARGVRDSYRARARVRRSFSPAAQRKIHEALQGYRARKAYLREGKAVWRAEVWLELLSPTKSVARSERYSTLEKRIVNAVNRAQKRMQLSFAENKRYVLCFGNDGDE